MSKDVKLLFAAKSNKLELVKNIITAEPRLINVTDLYGYNCILYAIENQNIEMTQFLIDQGANIHQITILDDTGLTIANKHGNSEIIAIINKNSSNPFVSYEIKDFISWEVTNIQMPFPRLVTSTIENGPISNADEIRTFIGAYKSVMMNEKIFNANIFEQPKKKYLETSIARMIVIDLLPVPDIAADGSIDIRRNLLNLLKINESYKVRKISFSSWSIDYFADYDINKLVNDIEIINKID